MRRLLVLIVVGLALVSAMFVGFLVHAEEVPPFQLMDRIAFELRPGLRRVYRLALGQTDLGVWNRGDSPESSEATLGSDEEIERLRAIGYLSGSEAATSLSGVTLHRSEAFAGLNLYNSGHAPEATLIDMDGEVVHRWRMPFRSAFPDARDPEAPWTDHWRRVHVFENGDLLAIYEGQGIIKLDQDSNLLWARYNGSHHDLQVLENGEIWVLTRIAHVNPSVHPWKPILEDYVTALTPDGEEIATASILDAFQDSHFDSLLEFTRESGDIFHTNALQVLDGRLEDRSPAFRKGNVLLSINELNLIAIMDFEEVEIRWVFAGLSKHQHDSEFLANGNILMIDNEGHRGFSKVVELDPLSQSIVWGYFGDEGNGFLTKTCGANQRLPNGNTLITESNAGRAFEVDESGRIVWEFHNPHRAGDDDELVATLFEVQRLPADFPGDWARTPTADATPQSEPVEPVEASDSASTARS